MTPWFLHFVLLYCWFDAQVGCCFCNAGVKIEREKDVGAGERNRKLKCIISQGSENTKEYMNGIDFTHGFGGLE